MNRAEIINDIGLQIKRALAQEERHQGQIYWRGMPFFGNLPCRLPGNWDFKPNSSRSLADSSENHSDMYRSQTYGEFCKELEKSVTDSNLSLDDTRRMDYIFEHSSSHQKEDFDWLYHKLFPVFFKMRMKGYNNSDLVC